MWPGLCADHALFAVGTAPDATNIDLTHYCYCVYLDQKRASARVGLLLPLIML